MRRRGGCVFLIAYYCPHSTQVRIRVIDCVHYSTGMYFVIVLPVQIVLGNLGDCSIGVLRSLEYYILWVSSLGSPSKIDPWKWNAGLKQVNKTINNGNNHSTSFYYVLS